jgi:multiple sugar transport system substrate-binding protein
MKKTRFLVFVLLGLILAVSLVFVACNRQEGGGGQQTTSGSTSGPPLEIWTMFTGADGITFTEMVENYNSTNPTLRVNHIPIEANDLYLRLQLAVASGQGVPDMAMNHIERIALFQEQGRVVDLSPYLASSPVRRENYNPKAWAMTEIAGGHYGVPLDVHSYILWVNWDLYNRYGLNDLDDGVLTWDEAIASARRILATGDGVTPIGLGWHRVIFLASYAQLGGTLSQNGTDPSFDNPIARQVIEHYRNMVSQGWTHKWGEDAWRMFLGGEILYMPEGIWMYNDIKGAGLNARGFDFPVFDARTKGNWTSSHQFTIPTKRTLDTSRIAASLEFINWVGQNSNAWAIAGQMPAHVGGQRGDLQTLPQAFLANENDELKIYGYKYYGDAVEALDVVLSDMFYSNITVDAGIRQAMQETRDRLEANR